MQRSLLTGYYPLLALLAALLLYRLSDAVPFLCSWHSEAFGVPLLAFQGLKLHTFGLKTWFCPDRPTAPPNIRQEPQWNLLQHLGGNGPWVQYASSHGSQFAIEPPEDCDVEQVHMVW